VTESISLRADDDFLADDSHSVLIEVRFKSATSCGNWTLDVTGNTAATAQTCDP
jgi:hypothetical protein